MLHRHAAVQTAISSAATVLRVRFRTGRAPLPQSRKHNSDAIPFQVGECGNYPFIDVWKEEDIEAQDIWDLGQWKRDVEGAAGVEFDPPGVPMNPKLSDEQLFNAANTDNTGKLTLDQYLKFMGLPPIYEHTIYGTWFNLLVATTPVPWSTRGMMLIEWLRHDKNGDGFVTFDEMKG